MDSAAIKRRYLRKDVATPVRFEWDDENRSCLTTSVGEGGLYVHTLIPPEVGAQVQIEFDLPGQANPIRVMGEIRHSLENTYGSLPAGFGVQFLDLSEEDRQKIIEFVQSDE